TAVRGHVGAGLPVAGKRIDIRVRLDPDQTDAGHQLERIRVPVDKGLVETGIFGSFERTHSYHNLYRIDRSPAVSVSVHPLPGARSQVAALLSSDPNDRVELLSDSALRRNQQHIIAVFAFALLLIYLLIGAQFESFLLPLVLLLSLLPALSGSLVVLLLCGFSLNLNSFLGILILTGTAINISIILTVGFEPTTRIDRKRLLLVCGRRLKPIAATILSTVVAMIPIAVNTTGEGALQSNTAVSLMGGLVIGMISILFVFPVLYERFAGALRNRQ
ncbi:MAG: efflux RND transporter permease subunit, partial [Spirochaetaceae bacterium]